MDSSNLAVMLAPNLLHSGDGTDKMNANTEKRLKLQAAVVHCLIENAQNFGAAKDSLLAKYPLVALHSGTSRRIFLSLCLRSVTAVTSRESSGHDGLRDGASVPDSR